MSSTASVDSDSFSEAHDVPNYLLPSRTVWHPRMIQFVRDRVEQGHDPIHVPTHFHDYWHREIAPEDVTAILEDNISPTTRPCPNGYTQVPWQNGFIQVPTGIFIEILRLRSRESRNFVRRYISYAYDTHLDNAVIDAVEDMYNDTRDIRIRRLGWGRPAHTGHRVNSLPTQPDTPRLGRRHRTSFATTPPPVYSPAHPGGHPQQVRFEVLPPYADEDHPAVPPPDYMPPEYRYPGMEDDAPTPVPTSARRPPPPEEMDAPNWFLEHDRGNLIERPHASHQNILRDAGSYSQYPAGHERWNFPPSIDSPRRQRRSSESRPSPRIIEVQPSRTHATPNPRRSSQPTTPTMRRVQQSHNSPPRPRASTGGTAEPHTPLPAHHLHRTETATSPSRATRANIIDHPDPRTHTARDPVFVRTPPAGRNTRGDRPSTLDRFFWQTSPRSRAADTDDNDAVSPMSALWPPTDITQSPRRLQRSHGQRDLRSSSSRTRTSYERERPVRESAPSPDWDPSHPVRSRNVVERSPLYLIVQNHLCNAFHSIYHSRLTTGEILHELERACLSLMRQSGYPIPANYVMQIQRSPTLSRREIIERGFGPIYAGIIEAGPSVSRLSDSELVMVLDDLAAAVIDRLQVSEVEDDNDETVYISGGEEILWRIVAPHVHARRDQNDVSFREPIPSRAHETETTRERAWSQGTSPSPRRDDFTLHQDRLILVEREFIPLSDGINRSRLREEWITRALATATEVLIRNQLRMGEHWTPPHLDLPYPEVPHGEFAREGVIARGMHPLMYALAECDVEDMDELTLFARDLATALMEGLQLVAVGEREYVYGRRAEDDEESESEDITPISPLRPREARNEPAVSPGTLRRLQLFHGLTPLIQEVGDSGMSTDQIEDLIQDVINLTMEPEGFDPDDSPTEIILDSIENDDPVPTQTASLQVQEEDARPDSAILPPTQPDAIGE